MKKNFIFSITVAMMMVFASCSNPVDYNEDVEEKTVVVVPNNGDNSGDDNGTPSTAEPTTPASNPETTDDGEEPSSNNAAGENPENGNNGNAGGNNTTNNGGNNNVTLPVESFTYNVYFDGVFSYNKTATKGEIVQITCINLPSNSSNTINYTNPKEEYNSKTLESTNTTYSMTGSVIEKTITKTYSYEYKVANTYTVSRTYDSKWYLGNVGYTIPLDKIILSEFAESNKDFYFTSKYTETVTDNWSIPETVYKDEKETYQNEFQTFGMELNKPNTSYSIEYLPTLEEFKEYYNRRKDSEKLENMLVNGKHVLTGTCFLVRDGNTRYKVNSDLTCTIEDTTSGVATYYNSVLLPTPPYCIKQPLYKNATWTRIYPSVN